MMPEAGGRMTKQNDSPTIEVYRPGTPVVAMAGKSATIMEVRIEPDNYAPDNYRIRYKVALWPQEAPPLWWTDHGETEWLDPGEVRPIDDKAER